MIRDDDFALANVQNWDTQTPSFSCGQDIGVWLSLSDIEHQLSAVSSANDLNHMYYPNSGGADLETTTSSSAEQGCLELQTAATTHVINPTRLEFHCFDGQPEWSCFRLDCETLPSIDVGNEEIEGQGFEPLCERSAGTGDYLPRGDYDHNDSLPRSARVVWRWHQGGTFLIVPKGGDYNASPVNYDGRHDDMTSSEFREYIETIISEIP